MFFSEGISEIKPDNTEKKNTAHLQSFLKVGMAGFQHNGF